MAWAVHHRDAEGVEVVRCLVYRSRVEADQAAARSARSPRWVATWVEEHATPPGLCSFGYVRGAA